MPVADIRTAESHIGYKLPKNNICWCFGVFSCAGRVCHWLWWLKGIIVVVDEQHNFYYDKTSASVPSLFISCFQFTLCRAHLFSGCVLCVCVCECELVSWGVTHRGESPELRLTVKCSVSSETEREMVFCSRRAASSPYSIAHAEPSVWNALLSKFEMTWGDVPLLRYRGVLSFESSSVQNDKPRSSDGREQSEPPRPTATDYLPCFVCLSVTVIVCVWAHPFPAR